MATPAATVSGTIPTTPPAIKEFRRRGGCHFGIASFWPTREYMFFLHFFDQYSLSHPVVSPDGSTLVYAGFPASRGQADLSDSPRIFLLDTRHAQAEPVEIAEGSFASWDPAFPQGLQRRF